MPQAFSKFMSPFVGGLIAFSAIFHSGCATNAMPGRHILNFKEIIQYQMKLDPKTNTPVLISGISGSAFCVKSISKKVENDDMTILINVGFCNQGEIGDFSIPLEIPNDINRLTFGEDRHVLWVRGQSTNPVTTQ